MDPRPFVIEIGDGPIVATAIHDGHEMRRAIRQACALDSAARLREEDPYTSRIAAVAPTWIVATRSRFEVDLNRPRDKAVYGGAEDAWGLDVWYEEPTPELIADSLAVYDAFYAELERVLRDREQRYGKFVVLDCHSYDHRRDGVADPRKNPEINLGTGTVHERWRPLVDRFRRELAAHGFDVRENVKFQGGWMAQWIHQTFHETGVALALEFQKTFMDEWTGMVDEPRLDRIAQAIKSTLPGLVEALAVL
jgi:N-formylglutamate amidohydrolase